FHYVFSFSFCHVLEDIHIDDGAEIVDVTDENVFFATSNQSVERSAVSKAIKDISVTRWIPGFNCRIVVAGYRQERLFDDSGETRLIESENVDIVSLVFLNDTLGVVFSIE